VGYLLMQLPSNMLITRVRPSLYLGFAMTLWGVVSTCNAGVHSFGSLIAVRFFLGFVEAPFFPGAIFLMSSWYTRAELTRRISWFYSGNALANMFGGLLGAGILGSMEGAKGLAGWRWLFIIEGTLTIFFAILSIFVLPDYPHSTRWLSEEERAFASWRLIADINEADERHSRTIWDGAKLALKDYRLYLFIGVTDLPVFLPQHRRDTRLRPYHHTLVDGSCLGKLCLTSVFKHLVLGKLLTMASLRPSWSQSA
jgi:MFS family permease